MSREATRRRILLAGCGDLGTGLGLRLTTAGHEVIGLRRNAASLPAAFTPVSMDLSRYGRPVSHRDQKPADHRLRDLDAVVITLTPEKPTRVGYERTYLHGVRGLAQVLQTQPRRVVLVSSTRVLGSDPDTVAAEDTPIAPAPGPVEVLAAVEREAAAIFDRLVIVRPAGFYGPGRTRLIDTVRHGDPINHERWTNRIHRDDLVQALERLTLCPDPPSLLHAVDTLQAQLGQVASFIADLLSVPTPGHAEDERPTGKRIDGSAFADFTGGLIYPSYRQGFSALLGGRC